MSVACQWSLLFCVCSLSVNSRSVCLSVCLLHCMYFLYCFDRNNCCVELKEGERKSDWLITSPWLLLAGGYCLWVRLMWVCPSVCEFVCLWVCTKNNRIYFKQRRKCSSVAALSSSCLLELDRLRSKTWTCRHRFVFVTLQQLSHLLLINSEIFLDGISPHSILEVERSNVNNSKMSKSFWAVRADCTNATYFAT